MFAPKYTITNKLLAQIKQVYALIEELNDRHFPRVVLLELEKTARALSTYASTSIEGNPLPLTEVKKVLKSAPVHIRTSEQEVLNYNQALTTLNQKLNTGNIVLSLDLIFKIMSLSKLGVNGATCSICNAVTLVVTDT